MLSHHHRHRQDLEVTWQNSNNSLLALIVGTVSLTHNISMLYYNKNSHLLSAEARGRSPHGYRGQAKKLKEINWTTGKLQL